MLWVNTSIMDEVGVPLSLKFRLCRVMDTAERRKNTTSRKRRGNKINIIIRAETFKRSKEVVKYGKRVRKAQA